MSNKMENEILHQNVCNLQRELSNAYKRIAELMFERTNVEELNKKIDILDEKIKLIHSKIC